uniref:Uncharacterized protein n=1 Tax=Arion vulgaris TaxID=1028688 RepID=A0A0B7BN81_9EUPU
METEAVKLIFARSVRKRQLVYCQLLCDGDSKAFVETNTSFNDIQIVKEDFINQGAKKKVISLVYVNILKKWKNSHAPHQRA